VILFSVARPCGGGWPPPAAVCHLPAGLRDLLSFPTRRSSDLLGLNIQWGYGGLFNFAIMGFLMVGGASTVFMSYPVNMAFWESEGPIMLGRALIAFLVGVVLVMLARRAERIGIMGRWKTALVVLAWFAGYVIYRTQIDPAAAYIESTAGFVGGLGLHPILGWLFGGLVSAVIAFYIGKISLGLRTDYLAIA